MTPMSRVVIVLTVALAGCAGPAQVPATGGLAPLALPEGRLAPVAAVAATDEVRPLYLSPAMAAFAERAAPRRLPRRRRLEALAKAIWRGSPHGVRYDVAATVTAREAFESRRANCLGYSHLFVALARHVGLPARYQEVAVSGAGDREGQWLVLNQHVNVVGTLTGADTLTGATRYVVDIGRIPRTGERDARIISDRQALALHYNNLAIQALLAGDVAKAWGDQLRALALDRRRAFFWTNLGVIYHRTGQEGAAERSYRTALVLAPADETALVKLVAIEQRRGNTDAVGRLERTLEGAHGRDPWFWARQAQRAAAEGDFERASDAIGRALQLAPGGFMLRVAELRYRLERGVVADPDSELALLRSAAHGRAQRRAIDALSARFGSGPRRR